MTGYVSGAEGVRMMSHGEHGRLFGGGVNVHFNNIEQGDFPRRVCRRIAPRGIQEVPPLFCRNGGHWGSVAVFRVRDLPSCLDFDEPSGGSVLCDNVQFLTPFVLHIPSADTETVLLQISDGLLFSVVPGASGRGFCPRPFAKETEHQLSRNFRNVLRWIVQGP